jgi:GYD domain-containing protein
VTARRADLRYVMSSSLKAVSGIGSPSAPSRARSPAYDIVVLLEAPDDGTATSLALEVSSLGNVRTTTMRAFTADEMRGIVERGR